MSSEKVWTFPFERAQDIVQTLRTQLAYLVSDALEWRKRVQTRGLYADLDLSSRALRIVLDRPEAWEFRLFVQLLEDELSARRQMRLEHDIGLALDVGTSVKADNVAEWAMSRIDVLRRVSAGLNALIDHRLQLAFGSPGQAGSVEDIALCVRSIGTIYEKVIQWSREVRQTHLEPEFVEVQNELANLPNPILSALEEFGNRVTEKLDEIARDENATGPVPVTLVITVSDTAGLEKAMDDCLDACRRRRRAEYGGAH